MRVMKVRHRPQLYEASQFRAGEPHPDVELIDTQGCPELGIPARVYYKLKGTTGVGVEVGDGDWILTPLGYGEEGRNWKIPIRDSYYRQAYDVVEDPAAADPPVVVEEGAVKIVAVADAAGFAFYRGGGELLAVKDPQELAAKFATLLAAHLKLKEESRAGQA